jgi:hypothetical protein
MHNQPIASISQGQLDFLIKREFPELSEIVSNKLKFVASDTESGRRRISVAILKLANRDFRKLDTLIEKANFDFRDVVSQAEYPTNSLRGFDDRTLEQEMSEHRADWEDYAGWLSKTE